MGVELFAAVAATLAVLSVMIAVGEGLVEYLIAPLFDKYEVNKFWLPYVAAGVIGGLVLATGANLFELLIPNVWVGKVLTAIAAGRGGNWLHDIFSAKAKQAAEARAARAAHEVLQRYYAAQTQAALIRRGHVKKEPQG